MSDEPAPAGLPDNWRELLREMRSEWDEIGLCDEEILAQIGREKPLREFLQEMRAQLVKE